MELDTQKFTRDHNVKNVEDSLKKSKKGEFIL